MKLYFSKLLVFFLAFIFLSSMIFPQGRATGAIEGKVTDSEGSPFPGVDINISSPNMIGGDRTLITNASGRYRFLGLSPGTYSVEISLQGFTSERREGVRVHVGKTVAIDFTLEISALEEQITVIAENPVVDVKDSGIITTTIDTKVMTSIVFDRGYYTFDVMGLAPGIVGTQAYGSRSRNDNVYQVDGVDTSFPSGGQDWIIPDVEVFEEAQVMGLGAPAEYDGFTGVTLNLISKSGGNKFDGMAQFIFNNWDWFTGNIDVTEPKYSLYEAPDRRRYVDGHLSLGGPILRDKLWFYAAYRYVRNEREVVGLDNDIFKAPKYFAKLTFQATPSIKLWTFAEYDDFIYDYRGISPQRPKEATNYEYSPVHVYNLSGLFTLSNTTFLETKIAYNSSDAEYGGYAGGYPGKDVSGHLDDSTGVYSENYDHYDRYLGYRALALATLSHHADEFIKGSHDFKLGIEYERIGQEVEWSYNGGFWYVDNVYSWYDYQLHNYAYEYSYTNNPKGTRVSFFAQDAWKISDALTINAGIRYNLYRGYLKSLDATPFKTDAFAPRIGLTWDVFGDHKTALKVHYGKYIDSLTTNKFSAASTGTSDWVMYDVMPDGSKLEVYRANYSNPATIDPDIKMYSVDQFTLGIERELMKDTFGGASFVWKKWSNFIYRINAGAIYVPEEFTFTDENGIQQSMVAHNQTSPSSQDQFYMTNPKAADYSSITADPKRDYIGFILEFDKKFSKNWLLNASYSYAKTTRNSTSRDPNSQINSLYDWPNHQFKVYATFVLPFDINFSPYFQWMSGGRWAREVRAPVRGSPYVMIEKTGTNKLPDTVNLDLRIEKDITIKGDIRIGFMADIFNVFNQGRETSIVELITSSNFGKAQYFNQGRLFRLGIRIYY